MTFWLLALLVFGVGARITRLITKDSLLENFRDKWGEHFEHRQDLILRAAATLLPASKAYSAPELEWPERRMGLLREIQARSQAEQAVPLTLTGEKREDAQPWTVMSSRLYRLRTFIEFITCPWCVGFWVFLLAWIFAWGAGLGFAYNVAGGPFWAVLPALALSYGWVYALVAMRLDAG